MAKIHKVEAGEHLSGIADMYGFVDWHTIYDHPKNAQIKRQRPDPHILYPGDLWFIPDRTEKKEARATDQRHTFEVKSSKILLSLVIKDQNGKIYANKRYSLKIEDQSYKGRTNAQGRIEEKIPLTAKHGELHIWFDDEDPNDEGYLWPLEIGYLDPLETLTGVQGRLNNLGFDCGSRDGILGPKTTAALEAFQAKYGLQATGELDSATRNKLREIHEGF